jgi:ABC-type dipeptide/oligopeptide/nickel transport system permease component
MVQFLIKRMIGLIFVIVGVTFITFILGYFAPGDPIRDLMGTHYSLHTYIQLKHAYGLDLPWYQQYLNFMLNLAQLKFGYSFQYQNRAVSDILAQGVPVSAELAFWALVIQVGLGVPLGIISALKANSWIDTLNMGTMLIFFALPTFVLAVFAQILILWLDGKTGGSWPVAGWGTVWSYLPGDLTFKIAPILVFALGGVAFFARLSRASMLEVMRQDYVRTARAKGLSERLVVYRHSLRNALIPLLTVVGLSLGTLVTGAFFIENIFNIPGIGFETVNSILQRDYPVIQATTVLLAAGVVVGNLLADVFYTMADPRIKIQ